MSDKLAEIIAHKKKEIEPLYLERTSYDMLH